MKLRLSVWAEGLRSRYDKGVFVVVTCLHKEPGVKPTVVGQTEAIASTNNPDWTKSLVLDYEFGQDLFLILALNSNGSSTPISSTLFEVGQVLGYGGSLAKELKDGHGVIAVRIEECKSFGQAQIQIRGINLKNLDGIGLGMNKSDPFFEFQRQRVLSNSTKQVWDTVYRSITIDNNLNPIFPEFFMDLDELSGGSAETKFRIVVNWFLLASVNDLIDNVNDSGLQSDLKKIDASRALSLKVGSSQQETGKIIVIKAMVTGVPDVEEPSSASTGKTPVGAESISEIPVANADDEFAVEASDTIGSTFCNYVAGGCQLRVMCAIDTTASNGDPRQESSLHFFNDSGLNSYESALKAICSIASKYDSDQKYAVFGFGAKRDGIVNHCFPFGSATEVDGVDGILKVYRETLRSGILMSSPRDFSDIIRTAGASASENMKNGQAYSILVIFTNGLPADSSKTQLALKEVNDAPLSVVFIGIGAAADLEGLKGIENSHKSSGCRDSVRFVQYRTDMDPQALTLSALQDIPQQLESYFIGKNIHPGPPYVAEEIAVLPYSPVEDVEVPMVINQSTGEVTVTTDVKPPDHHGASTGMTLAEIKKLGKKINQNRTFQRIKYNVNSQAIYKAKCKVNRIVGHSIL